MSAFECEAIVRLIQETSLEEWARVGDDDGDEDDHRGMADKARSGEVSKPSNVIQG